MSAERRYDVYRKSKSTGRNILVRIDPCSWVTAVSDYQRYKADGFTVSIFEVNALGDKIREVTVQEIKDNQPKDVEA